MTEFVPGYSLALLLQGSLPLYPAPIASRLLRLVQTARHEFYHDMSSCKCAWRPSIRQGLGHRTLTTLSAFVEVICVSAAFLYYLRAYAAVKAWAKSALKCEHSFRRP